MKLSDLTGLGRGIDLRNPTSLAINLIIWTAAIGWTVATADPWQGLRAGLDVFFAWALCRELDPDHSRSGFLAAALVLAGLALFGASTGPVFWLLLVMRVVNRTTGLSATLVDSALVLYLGVTAGWGLVAATAFALDALLTHGRRRQWFFTAAALVASFGYPPSFLAGYSLPALFTALSLAALFLPVCYASRRLASVDDTAHQPLDSRRVRCAQILALGVGVLDTSAVAGGVSLLPLWAAASAASLWRVALKIPTPCPPPGTLRS